MHHPETWTYKSNIESIKATYFNEFSYPLENPPMFVPSSRPILNESPEQNHGKSYVLETLQIATLDCDIHS